MLSFQIYFGIYGAFPLAPLRFASGRAFRGSAIASASALPRFARSLAVAGFAAPTIPNAKKKRNSKEFRLRNHK